MKRFFDFSLGLILICLLAPVYFAIYLALRVSIGAPVFFVQKRPGLYGTPFNMIKFRTMSNETDEEGKLLPDEQRINNIGRFLRSTSLDELPELINVLKGEMSLVGPRPLLMEYLPLYSKTQMRRHEVRPGITGWAQINGRNAISWDDKFSLDVWYVENRTFSLDIKILFATVGKVLNREGISGDGCETAKKFEGN